MSRADLLDRMRARAADLDAMYAAALPTLPDHVVVAVMALQTFVHDELKAIPATVIDPLDLFEIQHHLQRWRGWLTARPGGLAAAYAVWFTELFTAYEVEALDAMLTVER